MTHDFSVALLALSTQRTELEIAARDLGGKMDTVHSSETGVLAPVGRTGLREMLEGALGEARAHVRLGEDDISTLVSRITIVETQSQDLDLRLGTNWEALPL